MGLLTNFLANVASVLVTPRPTPLKAATHHKPLLDELAAGVLWLDQGEISTGNAIAFDNPIARVYPAWTGAGLTGNITISATNAVIGGRALVKHSDATAFADPAEVLNPTKIFYNEGTDNYFLFTCVSISPMRVRVETLDSAEIASRIQNAANTASVQATVGGNVEIAGSAVIIDAPGTVMGSLGGSNLSVSRTIPEVLATMGARVVLSLREAVQSIGDYGAIGNSVYLLLEDALSRMTLSAPTIRLPQYTSARSDAATTRALYTDANGDLKLGDISGAGGGSAYYLDPVANVAALQAVDSTSAANFPNGAKRRVLSTGDYHLVRGDATAESLPFVVVDAAGNRWFQYTAKEVQDGFSIGDASDVDVTTTPPTDGQALVWDNAAGDWVPGTVAPGTSSGTEESSTATFPFENTRMGVVAPITGNISINPATSNFGATFYMVHNDASAPAVSGVGITIVETVSVADNYKAGEDNIICAYYFSATEVHVWIVPTTAFTAPTAFSMNLTGTGGSTLSFSYSYSGTYTEAGSTYQVYRANDGSGTGSAAIGGATGSTSAAVGGTYALDVLDDAKYIRIGITARDDQGNASPEVFTPWEGPQVFAAAFSPLDIAAAAGMVHFKDFTDVASITIDTATYSPTDAVADITDAYTALVADRAVAAQRPHYLAASAGTGTHRAYKGNATSAPTSELVEGWNSANNIPANSSLTTILGVLIKDITNTEVICSRAPSGGSAPQFEYRKQGADLRIYMKTTGGNRLVVNQVGFFLIGDVDENMVITHKWTDGGSHALYKDKVDQSATSAFTESVAADTTNQVWIGSNGGVNGWIGEIGVILQYTSALSPTDQSDCEDWVIAQLSIP